MEVVGRAVNRDELGRYLRRVGDRWELLAAYLGGARIADERGAPPLRERGPEFVVVLVSDGFQGVPWLERVYVAGSLWDALEMGAPADIHCYTKAEFGRKSTTLRAVHEAVWRGLDLVACEPSRGLAVRGGTGDEQSTTPRQFGRVKH